MPPALQVVTDFLDIFFTFLPWARCTAAAQLFEHRQKQAIMHAVRMDLKKVDLEMPHDAIDDRQSWDDDVGPVGIETRLMAALISRHFSEQVDHGTDFNPGDLVIGDRKVWLAFMGHHHAGKAGEGAARADQQVKRKGTLFGFLAELAID